MLAMCWLPALRVGRVFAIIPCRGLALRVGHVFCHACWPCFAISPCRGLALRVGHIVVYPYGGLVKIVGHRGLLFAQQAARYVIACCSQLLGYL